MLDLSIANNKVLIANIIIAFVIPLPLSLGVVSYIVGAMVLFTVISSYPKIIPNKKYFLFYQVYLIAALFVIFSPSERFQTLEVRLPFILFPLFLSFPTKQFELDIIKKSFIIGVLVYILWSFLYILNFYITKPFAVLSFDYTRYIVYHYMPAYIHHTYMGMYLISAYIILSCSRIKIFGKYNILVFGVILTSFLLLSSKMSFIVLAIIFTTKQYKKLNVKYIATLSFSVIIFSKIFYTQIISSLESRIIMWKASIAAFSESPVYGYGTDSAKFILEKFLDNNEYIYNHFGSYKIDTHNLYLDFAINF